MKRVEYRVREVKRYIVTRFEEDVGVTGSVTEHGMFPQAHVAFEVAYALCGREHELSGEPPGSEMFQYPQPLAEAPVPVTRV